MTYEPFAMKLAKKNRRLNRLEKFALWFSFGYCLASLAQDFGLL